MSKNKISLILVLVALQLLIGVSLTSAHVSEFDPLGMSATSALPLTFVEQPTAPDAPSVFEAASSQNALRFQPDSVWFQLALTDTETTTVQLAFAGANPHTSITGEDPLPGYTNYFIGNDPSRWRTGLSTYTSLRYNDLYTGIDLHYTGQQGSLKGTYLLAAGADPALIRWTYTAVEALTIDSNTGDLHIHLPGNHQLVERAPIAWQVIGQREIPVAVSFTQYADQSIGFNVGSYDPAYPLVLDPIIEYSTYIGGSFKDKVWDVAVDNDGFAYITGHTLSPDFPVTPGAVDTSIGGSYDAFIAKIDTNLSGPASLVWSTYLGGIERRSDQEYGASIDVDDDGYIYMTGRTYTPDFPTTPDAFAQTPAQVDITGGDIFLVKLPSDGSTLLYSTYISSPNRDDPYDLQAVGNGEVFLLGSMGASALFPTTPGAYETTRHNHSIMLMRLSTNLPGEAGLLYFSYIYWPNTLIEMQRMYALADGNVYIVGLSKSTTMPVTPNAIQTSPKTRLGDNTLTYDAYLMHLDTTRAGNDALMYGTYLGGSQSELWGSYHNGHLAYGYDSFGTIAVDEDGIIYIAGATNSPDLPVVNGFQNRIRGGPTDSFIARINPAKAGLAAVEYLTYLGGSSGVDFIYSIEATRQGNVYISGSTMSGDFPLRDPIQRNLAGGASAFIAKIDTTLVGSDSLIYSTYVGRESINIGGLAIDDQGTAYIGGSVFGGNFPLRGAFQTTFNGEEDGFLTKLSFRSDLTITKTFTPDPAVVGEPLVLTIHTRSKGPENATGVIVNEYIPDNLFTFISAVPEQGTCTYEDSLVYCELGLLEVDQRVKVVITLLPLQEAGAVEPSPDPEFVGTANAQPSLAFAAIVADGSQSLLGGIDGVERDDFPQDNTVMQTLNVIELPHRNRYETATPTLTWGAVTWASAYEIRVDRLPRFDNPVFHQNNVAASSTAVTLPALENGRYYWQVRARQANGSWGRWSEIDSFFIDVP